MADTSVFTRLKRLFSTDVLIRNVGGSKLKTLDFSKYQQTGQIETNSMVDRYNRLYTCLLYTSPSPRDRQKSRMPSSA